MGFSVRQLTVLDMHGMTGGAIRRKIVTAEFFLAVVFAVALAILLAVHHAPWPWTIALLGVGLNYVPLAIHAVRFLPGDAVERELAGVDVQQQLRPYSLANLLLFVPGLFLILGLMPGEWRPVPPKRSRPSPAVISKDAPRRQQ
jgi:hypothetical protein